MPQADFDAVFVGASGIELPIVVEVLPWTFSEVVAVGASMMNLSVDVKPFP